MKTYMVRVLGAAVFAVLTNFCLPTAFAQDQEEPQPTPSEQQGEPEPAVTEASVDQDVAAEQAGMEPEARWGLGLRVRGVVIPQATLELFWKEVAGGGIHPGFGLDVVRVKEDFELRIGVEWENLSPKDGYWLERGDDAVTEGEEPDLTEFDNFGWVTADVSFIFHWTLAEFFAIRYGAGIGLGVIIGKVETTDAVCTSANIQQDCMPRVNATKQEESLLPVFPVVNLLAGVQFRPHPDFTINLEGGIRTVPFFGLSATYLFF